MSYIPKWRKNRAQADHGGLMEVRKAIEDIYRRQHSKMVAALTSYFGFSSIETAEDIVQDTFAAATEKWDKLPDNPEKWLYKVCKNKALNHSKKDKSFLSEVKYNSSYTLELENPADHELRLLSLCCDQRLTKKGQIIFTLHSFMGFSFYEISEALGMNYDAVNKYHQRVLIQLKSAGFTIKEQEDVINPEKLKNILHVLYLIFNEGYKATRGNRFIHEELCYQSLRLAKDISADPRYSNSEVLGLYSLFILHIARFKARINKDGFPLLLEDQDRSLWNDGLIKTGIKKINESMRLAEKIPSRYTLEAAIASVHSQSRAFVDTDWKLIATYYSILSAHYPSTFVTINHAIALLYGFGTRDAKEKLKEIPKNDFLSMHYSRYALLSKIEEVEGNFLKSVEYLQKSITLCRNELEVSALQKIADKINNKISRGINSN